MSGLIIDPDAELKFTLSKSEATPRCVLTLKHPGTTDDHMAFKVKTTQPRRYLVRPNQGLIAPGVTETVSILLVEKDKQLLLQSYERLGQSGLDGSKDKFLVQSCPVGPAFASKADGDASELYDALTSMWNSVTSGGSAASISNKKLHVRHVVQDGAFSSRASPATSKGPSPAKLEGASTANLDNMTQEQLVSELTKYRRKYDELVSFSVNLTAERDILSNTLEQTKRDFNRETAARSALESKQGGSSSGGGAGGGMSFSSMLKNLLIVAIGCYLAGVQMGSSGSARDVPIAKLFVMEPKVVDAAEE